MASESAEDPKVAAAVAAAEAAGPPSGESVRIDSWIWSVRLVKTRSLGAAACKGGHVRVNGERVKPSHSLRVGDEAPVRVDLRPGDELEAAMQDAVEACLAGSVTDPRDR